MTVLRFTCCCFFMLFSFTALKAQLYKIDLDQKVNKASLIVEGKVVQQQSFWNESHTMIFTSNTIKISKIFKGDVVSNEVEILTQGGSVGTHCLVVSDLLDLQKNNTGIFFCKENSMQMHSPFTKNMLYDVYSSSQGFLRYDLKNDEAFAPFAHYKNITQNLYSLIRSKTNTSEKIIDTLKPGDANVSNGTAGTLSTITSFSPATVHGGTLNDAANNTLTINGSGFGASPSNDAGIEFKDGNNDHTTPDYKIDYNSPYIILWTDTKIVVQVPGRAATGNFAVDLSDGTTVTSSSELQIFFSVLDADFTINSNDVVSEPRLMNVNGSGGYTFSYSTSTAGKGVNFSTSAAKETFLRALTTWQEIVGANLIVGSTTTVQAVKDDGVNIIVFDNDNTGVPNMADGVLEATYSWFQACQNGNNLLNAQKTGFDIIVRNDAASTGSKITLEDGPCFPATGSYDLEMIILHEIGHTLNLAHINDDYESSNNSYATLNPSKVMHYAIVDYANRRSPDAAAYKGALYTITPQHNTYGNCGLATAEMTPLTVTQISNDECPATFPADTLAGGTSVFFDLAHATSDKFKDPAYTQVNCDNTGTFVTNNAYYAFMNGNSTTLNFAVTNYTNVPSELSACTGQGIRLALYDVSACPTGQNFPQPLQCLTFTGNQQLGLTGLSANYKYLLYFDGLRNTKASFNIVFSGSSTGTNPANNTSVNIEPNPVSGGSTTAEITNTSGTFYQYALFDITGKAILTGKVTVVQSTQTFPVYLNNLSAGVYVLKIEDSNGKVISKSKILKL